jgi:hypothetical protein
MMIMKTDLICMCWAVGAHSVGLCKRGVRLGSLWGVGGGFPKGYCGEQNKMTSVLVYKRKFGWKIKMVHFYNFYLLLIKNQSNILYIFKKIKPKTILNTIPPPVCLVESSVIFSEFKYKISPRAPCRITLRILKITDNASPRLARGLIAPDRSNRSKAVDGCILIYYLPKKHRTIHRERKCFI